jgi:hypothetical protein
MRWFPRSGHRRSRSPFGRGGAPLTLSQRGLAGVTTNAISSVGNLSLTIAIAHRSAPAGLGRFAIAFALYMFITGIVRASITDLDLSLEHSNRHPLEASRQVSLVGVLLGIVVTFLGFALHSPYILLTGASLHGVLLYDYVKIVYMSRIRPIVSLVQECVWTVVTLIASTLCGYHLISPEAAYGIWIAACAAIGYWHVVAGHMSAIPRWPTNRDDNRLLTIYAFEQVVSAGATQISTYLVAAFGGLATVGLLRAAGTFFGPLAIISGTSRSVAIPELVQAGKLGPHVERARALRVMRLQIVIAGSVAGVITLLPLSVCRLVVGQNAPLVKPLLLPLAVEAVLIMVSTIAVAGHRARRSGRRSLAVFIVLLPVRLIPVAIVAHYGDAVAVAWTMAIVALIATLGFWWSYLHLISNDGRGTVTRGTILPIEA